MEQPAYPQGHSHLDNERKRIAIYDNRKSLVFISVKHLEPLQRKATTSQSRTWRNDQSVMRCLRHKSCKLQNRAEAGRHQRRGSVTDDSSNLIGKRNGRARMCCWQRLVCQPGVHRGSIGINHCTRFQAQPQPCRRVTGLAKFTIFLSDIALGFTYFLSQTPGFHSLVNSTSQLRDDLATPLLHRGKRQGSPWQ